MTKGAWEALPNKKKTLHLILKTVLMRFFKNHCLNQDRERTTLNEYRKLLKTIFKKTSLSKDSRSKNTFQVGRKKICS